MNKFILAAMIIFLDLGLAASYWVVFAQDTAKEAPIWEGVVMDRHLRELAGPDAEDCGRVRVRERPNKATACALKNFENKKPFYVRYDVQGIDSAVAGGLAARSSREVFAVEFDSMGWDSTGLPKESRISSDHHLITTPCPKPMKLLKTGSGRLTCFPPDPKAEHNIMSPNAEPF